MIGQKKFMSKSAWINRTYEGCDVLFYFTSETHVLENLKKKRIKISNFKKCNDIFELSSFSMKSKTLREKFKVWSDDVNDSHGLVCLSRDWRNPMMWGHYANNGKGVCLVFKVNKQIIRPVEYIAERQKRDPTFEFPEPENKDDFEKFCSKKFSAWAHEKEVRIFCDLSSSELDANGPLRFKEFSDDFSLLGIINGPRPVLTHENIYSAIASGTKPKPQFHYFQSRPAFKQYKVVCQQSKELWI